MVVYTLLGDSPAVRRDFRRAFQTRLVVRFQEILRVVWGELQSLILIIAISQVLVWDVVSEVWELAGYLDSIQYYPAILEVSLDRVEGYCS